MDTKSNDSRVVMLPWLGHGHILPFLELAKKLSRKSFQIYFCSTPINLNPIKNKISDYNSIELVEFLLPSSPELLPHFHTTNGLPPHLMSTLVKAFEMSSPNFSQILKTLNPDLIIYDINQPWVPKLASSHQIPAVHFQTSGATASAYFYCLVKNPGIPFPSTKICLNRSELIKISQPPREEGDENRVFECFTSSNEIMLIKSSREIEGKFLDCLSALINKRIVPVGPLVQELVFTNQENDDIIMQWLSRKQELSTVYMSFGTESFLSRKDMEELAYGLELSNVNFIWVIKFPEGEKIKAVEALPQGFLERIGERGLVVEGWAPQSKILGHKSVGGFVSHCGWSSVMESIIFGVPIIAIPLQNDQPLNARLVVEVGFGLEVEKDERLEFGRGDVERVVKEVVVEKRGEILRRKARELSEEMKVKGEEQVNGAIKELKTLCHKNYLD
uniref:Glycosyltransferase n=1 Tax=Panax notoginseng TaxID=44586 RepID=A0A977R933_9APIA|nr:UGT58 [Panax notoginseng]